MCRTGNNNDLRVADRCNSAITAKDGWPSDRLWAPLQVALLQLQVGESLCFICALCFFCALGGTALFSRCRTQRSAGAEGAFLCTDRYALVLLSVISN